NPLLAQSPVVVLPGPAGVPCGTPEVAGPASCACPHTKAVCVPEHYVKKTDKVVFCSRCEPVCLCHFHGLFGGCDCAKGPCGHAYPRHYLVKKKQTCEHDAVKCVPAEEPICERGHCTASSGCCAVVTLPDVAPAPGTPAGPGIPVGPGTPAGRVPERIPYPMPR